jgi:hypothetical protein
MIEEDEEICHGIVAQLTLHCIILGILELLIEASC